MKTRQEFIKELKKEVDNLEKQITNNKYYKIRNIILKQTKKIGITTTFLLPAMISSVLVYNGFKKINITPLKIDKISSSAKIITTKTSTQQTKEEEETYEYNFEYTPTIEHSTGWKLNENNLFERDVIVYKFNNNVNNLNVTDVLKMSNEEIQQFVTLTNKKKIQKASLDEEDYFYNDDMFVITYMHEDETKTKLIDEPSDINVLSTLVYLFIIVCLVGINQSISEKVKIYKKLINNCNTKYKIIELENIDELTEILKIRKENMELLDVQKKYVHNKR